MTDLSRVDPEDGSVPDVHEATYFDDIADDVMVDVDGDGTPDMPAWQARRMMAARAAARAKELAAAGAVRTAEATRATARVTASASAATGRAAWKFRVELLPLYAFGALLVLGMVHRRLVAPISESDVHSVVMSYGVGIAVCIGVIVVALKMPAARDGTTANSGAFMAAGALLGAVVLTWVAALVLAGMAAGVVISGFVLANICGIPYWKTVYGARNPQQVLVNLPASKMPPPEEPSPLDKVVKGAMWEGMAQYDWGLERMLLLPPGADPVRIIKSFQPKFATLLKAGIEDVEILDVPGDGEHLIVRTYTTNLLEGPTSPNWVKARQWDFLDDGIPIGRERTGEPVVLDMRESHLLIGGQIGSGKSSAMSLVMTAASLDPRVRLWCMDGKKTELVVWKPRAERYVSDDLTEAKRLLIDLREEMGRIADKQVERGDNKFDVDKGDHLIVLAIDELPRYTANKELRMMILDILQIIRSLGGMVVATAQRPSGDQVGADLRAQFTHRYCMRVDGSRTASMILGEGWPMKPHHIPKGMRGYGFLTTNDGAPRGVRADWMDQDLIRSIANRVSRLRPKVTHNETAPAIAPADVLQFPNGHPITNEAEQRLWLALPTLPEDHRKLANFREVNMSPGWIRAKLGEWAAQGWVDEQGKSAGKGEGPLRYAKPPDVDAEIVDDEATTNSVQPVEFSDGSDV